MARTNIPRVFRTRPPTTTSYKRGQCGNHKGRPFGAVNKVPQALKEAILIAAEMAGSDGKGKDGLVGYLLDLAINEKTTFAGLLGKVLPMTVAGEKPVQWSFTVEEATAEMTARGIPVRGIFDGPAELLPPANGHYRNGGSRNN